ncbi:MAG TPA: AsmA family protein [Caulobacteraceae bacterium]|nr:AsmA family protein [Caulobacteraceae bacterium]
MSRFEHVDQSLASANRKVGLAPKVIGASVLVLALLILLVLSNENWNFLRGPIGNYASARMGRTVRIDGDLRAHLLSWTPEIDVGGLKIGKPAWAGAGDMADLGFGRIKVRLLPLFLLRLELPLVELKALKLDLLSDQAGRNTWTLDSSKAGQPIKLPPINQFLIEDGQVHLVDQKRRLTFDAAVQASEKPVSAGGKGFSLDGKGKLNSDAFTLVAAGGPLIAVKRTQPYPFHLDIRDGTTHIAADGEVAHPFDMSAVGGTLAVNGPNLARLYDLTGISLPASPAYNLSAKFQRSGAHFALNGISGSIGQSDMEGALAVDTVSGRRKLTADLASRKLNFPDLLAIIGGPAQRKAAAQAANAPAEIKLPIGAKPASATGAAKAVLPDTPLQTARLRSLDADVSYRADTITAGVFAMQRASLKLTLREGVLTIDPLSFDLTQGRLFGSVRIDASGPVTKTAVDLRAADIGLQQVIHQTSAGQPVVQGNWQARARLVGVGDSVHKAAAAADGEVVFVIPRGQMRQAFAELLGINVGRGLFMLLSKDPKQTDIRCAVAQFDVHNGLMTAKQFVIDTGVVTATGSGVIDLGQERLDLKIKGQTKHPELLRIWTPIEVGGTLSKPTVGVSATAVAAQTGIAVGLGAILAPLSAVLPFVSAGLAKDADCQGLVTDARSAGAPVKVSQTTPPKSGSSPALTAVQH